MIIRLSVIIITISVIIIIYIMSLSSFNVIHYYI